MPVKTYRPTSPGRREYVSVDSSDITRRRPEKKLTRPRKSRAGRNNQGRVTVRHQGGGHKRKLRQVDWKRDKWGVPAKVAQIEYDPNRSARLALLHYTDGEKRYIVAPAGLAPGSTVQSGPGSALTVGNALALQDIPDGTVVHCVELTPGRGAQLARAAGSYLQVLAKDRGMATLRMPSGEMRMVSGACFATIGRSGNEDHSNQSLGKAGRSRHRGRRPSVRGSAMNPKDHPHGGGEGKAPTGMPPKTPWGRSALGRKTRIGKRRSDKLILRRRRTRR